MYCEAFFIAVILVIVYMTYNIICPEGGPTPLQWIQDKLGKSNICGCRPMPGLMPPPSPPSGGPPPRRTGLVNQGLWAGPTSNKGEGDLPELAAMEGYANGVPEGGQISTYDPVQMGAIKQSEVASHYNNLKDRSPFSAVGVTSAGSVRRDDDPYMRDSGIPWVGGLPRRAYKARDQGPGGGARQTISASASSLSTLGKEARSSKKWDT